MIYSASFLFCLIIAPLLANLRGWGPAALFFAVGAVYAVFGAISYAQFQISPSQVREAERAYRDTYYVVNHGYFLWRFGIAMAVFGAITWTQMRFGAMQYPTLTKNLFWVMHVAGTASYSFQGVFALTLPKPQRYIDYPEFKEIYVLFTHWSVVLSQAALLGLLCLLLWSVMATWLTKQR